MDSTEYQYFLTLERKGNRDEARQRLLRLASQGHPLGLLELSRRYLRDPSHEPDHYVPGPDSGKSRALADDAVQTLEELVDCGDAEAMLHLARVYLGEYGPWYDSPQRAENLLLESFQAGCHLAASDLHRMYRRTAQHKRQQRYQKS